MVSYGIRHYRNQTMEIGPKKQAIGFENPIESL